jgi:hypothetical protein
VIRRFNWVVELGIAIGIVVVSWWRMGPERMGPEPVRKGSPWHL